MAYEKDIVERSGCDLLWILIAPLIFKIQRHMIRKKLLFLIIISCMLQLTFCINNFSVAIASISVKLLGDVLQIINEGRLSQNVDLGPGLLSMLRRNCGIALQKNRVPKV